ncbi:hypothetical protein [uncultured Croceitalea sp.]|uniref:hypothetical protein n=1 Tax=uncultured Croceitalea sp. TaxID=1798908 RepID=UPI003305C4D7
MKNNYLFTVFACFCLATAGAQQSAKDAMLKKQKEYNDRTMVQRFEKTMVPTAAQRALLRKENEEKRKVILAMIDSSTLVKEKLRAKLRYDLEHDPFSSRLKKFLALYRPVTKPLTIAQNEK